MIQTGKILSVVFNNDNFEDKVELNLGDYEVKEESGKWFAVRKKKEYPKTYEECCKVLEIAVCNMDFLDDIIDTPKSTYVKNLDRLLNSVRKLSICREAYWKIAGEEMGLGKPWEPDWEGEGWYVIVNHRGDIVTDVQWYTNAILAFPTAEMRDAFKENFKGLINECKELL